MRKIIVGLFALTLFGCSKTEYIATGYNSKGEEVASVNGYSKEEALEALALSGADYKTFDVCKGRWVDKGEL